jgi:uncharacterized membrane protein YeaQ/YmgE (transglycosylase-associated protein family)
MTHSNHWEGVMEGLILNLVSGAVGGNVVERLIGSPNQGTIINSIAGILGGGLGGSILGMLGAPDMAGMAGDVAEMDIVALLGQVASGGVGGGVFLLLLALCAQKWDKPAKTTLKWGGTWFAPLA